MVFLGSVLAVLRDFPLLTEGWDRPETVRGGLGAAGLGRNW